MLLFMRKGASAIFLEIIAESQDVVTVVKVKTLCGMRNDRVPYFTTWGERCGKSFNIRKSYLRNYIRTQYGTQML